MSYLLGFCYHFIIFSNIEKIEIDPIMIPAPPTKIAKIRKFFCLFIIFQNVFNINYFIWFEFIIPSTPNNASSNLTVSVP